MITLLAASMMFAAQGDGTTILYRSGLPIKDQSISLKAWGSGICTETDDAAYTGTTSIRVTTKNLYQGGSILFGNAVNLSSGFNDKNSLLRVTFKALDSATGSAGAPGVGGPTGAGRGGGGGKGGDVDGGGFEGVQGGPPPGVGGPPPGVGGGRGGGFGAPPGVGAQGGGAAGAVVSSLNSIRLIITTTDGMRSEALLATAGAQGDRGWKQASVPLQAIKGFGRTNKIIKQVSFAGDVSTAFYVGDVRVVSDKTPIRGEANYKTLQTSVGIPVTFSGNGMGGSSVLKYTWDFDDADGIQVDAEGQSVRHKFRTASNDQKVVANSRKNGEFIVTLTISDAYGLKDSYQTQIRVKVNP